MSSIRSKIEKLTTAADLPQRLTVALCSSQKPKAPWHGLSPELGYGRHAGPAPQTARRATVVLLLFQRDGKWHLPLTERPLTLVHHAGQISLPGGAIEAGETPIQAALRELDEELGFSSPIEVIGQFPDCYVFASDFLVTPFLAAATGVPQWRPYGPEVQSVVELPIDLLLDNEAIGRLTIERGPLIFHAPCIRIGAARVWGATCLILNNLTNSLRQLLENL